MTAKAKLHTLLGTYPNTKALHEGRYQSDLVEFDFAEVKVANTLFKALVREHRFDAGEIATVTILQAKHFGTPYAVLPAVVVGRGSTTPSPTIRRAGNSRRATWKANASARAPTR